MKKLKATVLHSLLIVLFPLGAMAQGYSGYNWYFGNSTQAIRFSRSDNSPTLDSKTPLNTGGSAVASNQVNGDLLFYTDGVTLYDASDAAMPGGTGLPANPTGNQPVAVAKVPGTDNQYYVFTISAAGAVDTAVVDMTLNGNATAFGAPPLGDVLTAPTPTGITGRSEAMITVPHADGDSFWLITHANGSADYSVTLFTAAGPPVTTVFAGLGLITNAANFSYHAGTNRIAVSPFEGTRDVEILTFDPATGALGFQQRVLNSGVASATNAAVYDTEWSLDGRFLYLSRTGEPSVQADVLQYDLNNPTTSLASVLPQPNTIFRSFGLQVAPDSAIYHLYQATNGGPFLLGKLTDIDSIASLTTYNDTAFAGNFNGMQFPSFAPSDTVNLAVTFVANGLCANSPTGFFPTVTPGADSLRWDFGDGSGSSDWSPVYTYTAGGSFNVSVTAFLNGQTATATQPITINNFDAQITLVQDTVGCSCQFPVPKDPTPAIPCPGGLPMFSVTAQINNGSGGTPTLQWFGPGGLIPGATSATLAPDSAGYYYLVATVGGCSTYAGVNIREYNVQDERSNIWYFGDKAGLDFNPPAGVVPISNPVMNAPEGTSTISDRNGQVIFFTDGETVWNRTNVPLNVPPGSTIGGEKGSSQAALIIPVPGDETLYYIFTTQQVQGSQYELRYSLFDLKLNGGTGGLSQQNVLLFSRSTERITGNANWLIAHEYGNNSFRAYRISNLGIGNPVISGIGSDHSIASAENGQGYMKLGAQDRLVVALSTAGVSNVVEIFDFTDSTGAVTNFRRVDLNNTNGQVYGVEFSNGGNKLFATIKNTGSSQIAEIAFDSLGVAHLMKPPKAPITAELGAIQTGPDGNIYVAVNGAGSLGVIDAVEDTTTQSTFRLVGQGLVPGTSSSLGLPNFIQHLSDPIQQPGMSIVGECVQDSVSFAATKSDPIDDVNWNVTFNGASIVRDRTDENFKFLFTTPGTYKVKLVISNRCGFLKKDSVNLQINGAPPDPTTSAVLCTGAAVLDANPSNIAGLTYVWSTGDSTETITVNRQGQYSVTVTNASGCTTDGNILAVDNRPVADLGDNLTICQNTPIAPLDAQNPGATYAWTIANPTIPVPSGTSRVQRVNTSVPGVFEYEVVITDPITTCFLKDSVIFTINPSPVISNLLVTSQPTCNAVPPNGGFSFDITGPAGRLFSYSITGPVLPSNGQGNNVSSPITIATLPELSAGTYGITVADQVSGCATTTAIPLNNNDFTVTGGTDATCDPINISVTLGGTVPPVITYRVVDVTAPTVTVSSGSPTTPNAFQVKPPQGMAGFPSNRKYIVEVTSSAGCVVSDDVDVTRGASVQIQDLSSNVCTDPITLSVVLPNALPATYAWTAPPTGPSIAVGTESTAQAQLLPSTLTGTFTYGLRVSQANACTVDTTLAVTIQPPITAAISQSDACADRVTVTATPSGSFLYRWSRNNTLDLTLAGPQVTALLANDNQQYSVQIYNPITGCNSPSNSLVVQVDGALDVALTTTPPCEGSAFTLTATPSRGPVTYVWAVGGSPIAGQTNSTLSDQRAGTYTVVATAAACSVTESIDIILNPVTPGLLTDERFICNDPANPDPNTREAILSPGQYVSYDWFKDGVNLGITTPTLTAAEPGLFSVNLVNNFGCASSDKTNILIECDPVITGPNAFRPTSVVQGVGGDPVNQSFKLFTFFIDDSDFQVFIFNRWGEMIYTSSQRDFRWNGGYNNNPGQQAPAGTYSYVVRYKSSYRPEQGIQERRGGVVLLR